MYPTGYRSVCHRHREPCARASTVKYIKAGDRSRCDLLGGDVIYTAFVASVCPWWRRRRFEVRGTRLSSSSMFNASGSHDKSTGEVARIGSLARCLVCTPKARDESQSCTLHPQWGFP